MERSSNTIRDEITDIIYMIGKPTDEDAEIPSIRDFLLEMNSLKFIELITSVENRYGIALPSDDLMKFKSGDLDLIADAVWRQVSGQTSGADYSANYSEEANFETVYAGAEGADGTGNGFADEFVESAAAGVFGTASDEGAAGSTAGADAFGLARDGVC